jgi:hypothetical protein
MPVTARLSQRFYERFGDDVTNELVEWFNAVDATYKAELKEFNELNFARFDAKVEQRFAQADAKLEQRFALLDQRFTKLEADLRVALASGLSGLRAQLMTWIVGLWITSALSFAGIALTLWRLR